MDDLLLSTSTFRYPVPIAQKARLLAAVMVRGGLSIRHKAAAEGDIQYGTLFRLHRSCARCLPRCSLNVLLASSVLAFRLLSLPTLLSGLYTSAAVDSSSDIYSLLNKLPKTERVNPTTRKKR